MGWWRLSCALVALSCASNPPPAPPPPWVPANELEADCASMCRASIAAGCELTDNIERCAKQCAESVAANGLCRDVSQIYARCLGEVGLETCVDVPEGCSEERRAWAFCSPTGEGCGPVVCGAPEVGCTCGAFCDGALVEEHCEPNGDGYDCTCAIDGEVVATCPETNINCAFFIGCCAEVVVPQR